MKTAATIKYLPSNTSKEDIAKIRKELNYKDHKLILIISGKENILENLCDFIKCRTL